MIVSETLPVDPEDFTEDDLFKMVRPKLEQMLEGYVRTREGHEQ